MFAPQAPALPAPSLYGLLQRLAQDRPEKAALRWLDPASGERLDWTFAQLVQASDAIAAALTARGWRLATGWPGWG